MTTFTHIYTTALTAVCRGSEDDEECDPPPLCSEDTTLERDVAAQEAAGIFLTLKISIPFNHIYLSLY